MAEIGHASPRGVTGLVAEDNWQLTFPNSTRVYSKMLRQDAQVQSILKAVTLPIRRSTWRIDPNGAPDAVVQHIASDLRLPVLGQERGTVPRRRGRVSWDAHLQKALLALPYGHMFFEQVYQVGDDGLEHLVKLAPRLPGTVSKINVADDGGLESIEQHALGHGGKPPVIPVSRLVAYCFEPMDSTWLGSSILRPAYKHWKLRDRYLRLEAQVLERNGMGIPTYEASPMPEDARRELQDGQAIVEGIRSGAHAGVSIPNGARFDLKGISGQVASPREAIDYHDAMMAKAVLAHVLNLSGKGGSYALAETQNDLFVQSLQSIADWIIDTANQHIVEDLVELAWPDYDGPAPLLMADPIASKKELTAEALALLANAKVLLMDPPTEAEVRRRYQLPEKDPDYIPELKNGGGDDAETSEAPAGTD
ncbi:phage portal protein family protein [Corynebacterium pseudopelargi]|uniref:Phage portal protein, SPP1 Gp6-like n=1 Tax=Corynebacterium pseudopelargi TaxID=2080757 RepID=A0A3G6IT42_9CORY|nr:hypothetical protein [Corynebacterium pseudopelargi]AZA08707.1 hypothetical protein CPPEL_02880 [Corynebacterium pseudopelargi]